MEQEYPVPGYEGYFATESGDIISYKGKQSRVLKQVLCGGGHRCRLGVSLCRNKTRKTETAHRVILSAKLGRKLEDWEQTCHIDGNSRNNRMNNLQVGCFVNNAIDCLENGNRKSRWIIEERPR